MKQLTPKQVEGRKRQAVRFVRDVLDDPDRADEIERESLEDYAARRKIQMSNPERKFIMARPRKTIEEYKAEVDDLKDQVSELEEENEALAGQLDEIQEILEPEEEEAEEEEDSDQD